MPWDSPYFWSTLGLFGWFLVPFVVGSRSLGSRPSIGYVCTAFLVVPTFLLPLSFVAQPRFDSPLLQTVGIVITVAGLVLFVPTFFQVRAFTLPQSDEALRTRGFYGIVRHPMTLGGVVTALGWASSFGSVIGVGVAFAYALCAYLCTFIEEERLVEEYGDDYRRYQRDVPRLFPYPRHRGRN